MDRPDVAAGRAVNVTDERTVTVGQWIGLLAEGLGIDVELVAMPRELARPAGCSASRPGPPPGVGTELLCGELAIGTYCR
ncbi:MAG: hypothetical protein R2749_16545 [Acidimicrobiales bacterium]